jgi:branched-chain amino acid aminotransferase
MSRVVLFNGELVSEGDAHVAICDGGWLHGAGLFETIRAANGRVFRLDAHLGRLRNSAEKILRPLDGRTLPTADQLQELLRRNELVDARLRITVSAGEMRPTASDAPASMTVCVTAVPLAEYPPACYQKGITVVICPYRQCPDDPLVGHKTTSYLSRLLGLRAAERARCQEALWFTTRNELAEGSISNVFVVRNGRLFTPPLDTPVLPGIARAVVMETARKTGIDVQEARLGIDDLLDADECFLTNVVMTVMPVVRVERRDIGAGRVGDCTCGLLNLFREEIRKDCGPP